MKLTPELKNQIDAMTMYTLLYKNRFAPSGDPLFEGESGEYFLRKLSEKREADSDAFVSASKSMGWTK